MCNCGGNKQPNNRPPAPTTSQYSSGRPVPQRPPMTVYNTPPTYAPPQPQYPNHNYYY